MCCRRVRREREVLVPGRERHAMDQAAEGERESYEAEFVGLLRMKEN